MRNSFAVVAMLGGLASALEDRFFRNIAIAGWENGVYLDEEHYLVAYKVWYWMDRIFEELYYTDEFRPSEWEDIKYNQLSATLL